MHSVNFYDIMEISYRNTKIRKLLEDDKSLTRHYGRKMADKINQRISELQAAKNPQCLPPACRFHEHSGKRKGLFSLDLIHPQRLIICPTCEYDNYAQIISIEIYEIFNSHK